ncbi:MAG: transposase family protein [Euryarchaeota archaeon]|nr:transposase family protein [Euryarchaeota archaeon]
MDLGFTGFEKDYPDTLAMMPKKKPKGKQLTADAKAWNRIVSSFRVLLEHAIGGVKRFGTVSDKFRNRKYGFDDKVMLVSCGLWNYPSVVLLNRGAVLKGGVYNSYVGHYFATCLISPSRIL